MVKKLIIDHNEKGEIVSQRNNWNPFNWKSRR